jgi:hypothetical protein
MAAAQLLRRETQRLWPIRCGGGRNSPKALPKWVPARGKSWMLDLRSAAHSNNGAD